MTAPDPDRAARELEAEFAAGYHDGGDPASPEPSGNRSRAYRHSFEIRRRELAGDPIPASIARARVAEILAAELPELERASQPKGNPA